MQEVAAAADGKHQESFGSHVRSSVTAAARMRVRILPRWRFSLPVQFDIFGPESVKKRKTAIEECSRFTILTFARYLLVKKRSAFPGRPHSTQEASAWKGRPTASWGEPGL